MSGWGVSLGGFTATKQALEAISVEFDGATTYLAGPTVEYAIYQEKGTSSIEARPFVRPAAERVRTNMASEVRRISKSQGIPLNSEGAMVRCAALAVQDRMKEIANRKKIRKSGNLINSIRIAEVS